MISLLWIALAAGHSGSDSVALVPVDRPDTNVLEVAAPIRLWLNNSRQFREGEKARVQVETQDDGYLVVFNVDTEGRIRVVFPVDPGDDNFVRAGRRYEIRGRGDRESFVAGRDGDGLVYAAVSADPFRFDPIVSGGNWDYNSVNISEDSRDPEADVTDLLQRMASDRGFDYDVVTYRVYGYRDHYVSTWLPRPYGYWDDYYCDPYYRPSLFGCRYYPVHGWYLGYSPYRYGGYYGYNSWWYDPWYRNRSVYYSGNRNYPVVGGRPRAYTIVRRGNNNGSPSNGRFGSWGGSLGGNNSRPAINYRPRAGRPSRDDDRGRPSGSANGRPSGARPSNDASPSRPSGGDRPRARRSPPADSRPMIERDRGTADRGSVDFGDRRPNVNADAPSRADVPARRSGGDDGPRYERPRSNDRPRAEPRESRPAPRSEPRASEPRQSQPRAEPRQSAPRSEPSRPRSEGSRPRSGGGGRRP